MLTDCPDDAKCLVMWSLKDGSEIARITSSEDILSFSWSRDGKLLAISHITGLICLVDVINDFRTLAEVGTPEVCGILKFSPDNRVLFCLRSCGLFVGGHGQYLLNVDPKRHTLSLVDSSDDVSCDPREFESFNDCGFLLGDPIPFPGSVQRFDIELNFVLNHETELSSFPVSAEIKMLNTNEVNRNSQDATTIAKKIVLSLDGQTVYVVTDAAVPTVMAWDVFSGNLIAKKIVESDTKSVVLSGNQLDICLVPVREGVIFATTSSDTLEFWNFDMSVRLRKWTILACVSQQARTTEWDRLFGTNLPRITGVIPVTEERVACITEDRRFEVAVNVVDSTHEKIESTIPIPSFSSLLFSRRRVFTCNSKLQIVTINSYGGLELYSTDGASLVWKNDSLFSGLLWDSVRGVFSPTEQFIVIWERRHYIQPAYVLGAVSGNTLHSLSGGDGVSDVKFVSDEECVLSCSEQSRYHLQLFNVRSGHLLRVIDVASFVPCLAACPSERVIAIGQRDSTSGFKVLRVRLPRDKTAAKAKGEC